MFHKYLIVMGISPLRFVDTHDKLTTNRRKAARFEEGQKEIEPANLRAKYGADAECFATVLRSRDIVKQYTGSMETKAAVAKSTS